MFFEKHDLSRAQIGFRKGQSTVGSVLHDVENILNAFENKVKAAQTIFDLTKAFDCSTNDILMEFYGIRNC